MPHIIKKNFFVLVWISTRRSDFLIFHKIDFAFFWLDWVKSKKLIFENKKQLIGGEYKKLKYFFEKLV